MSDINHNLTRKEEECLKEYLLITKFCTSEQLDAMNHEIPMTRTLFSECLDICIALTAVHQLNRLALEYPEFWQACSRDIDRDLNIPPASG